MLERVVNSIWISSPVLLLGGTEMHIMGLGRCLSGTGVGIRIVTYHEIDSNIRRNFVEAGLDVDSLNWPRPMGGNGHLKLLIRLTKLLRLGRPSVVHVQYLAPGFIPILAAKLAHVKTVIATVHQINSYGWKARWIMRFAARLTDVFFCVSAAVERSWFGDSKIFEPGMFLKERRHWTIHNPVEVDDISFVYGNTEKDPDDARADGVRTVGVVGRLRGEKGQAVLLEAFAKIREGCDDLRLRVVGDGPDRAKLEARARELGIADCVEWMGSRPPEEVRRLYRTMDVVVVPSLAEGFGLVAAEALAAGRPVVASDVGGLPEVVKHGETGLLVPPDDAEALADAIARIMDDSSLGERLARTGKADVRERFSTERFNAAIRDAYGQLLRFSNKT